MSTSLSPRKKSLPARAGPTPLDAVSDDLVEDVYAAVRRLARDAQIDAQVRIGKVIVERMYGGDLEAWHSRGPKDASFRKLAARFEADKEAPDGTSAAALYRAVAIYELEEVIGVSVRKHLTVTHLRAVLGLPEEAQRKLLSEADKGEWTTRRIEGEAGRIRRKEARSAGRPPLPGFVKAATRLRGMLSDGEQWFGGLDMADDMDEEAVQDVLSTVSEMVRRLAEVERRLKGRLGRG